MRIPWELVRKVRHATMAPVRPSSRIRCTSGTRAPPPRGENGPTPALGASRSSGPPPSCADGPSPEGVSPPAPAPPAGGGPRVDVEANIGATTESNFYVGFSGEIAEGGVFLATYEVLSQGTKVKALVTLPGGFEFTTHGWVRFVRDPFDLNSEAEPGMGIQFEGLDGQSRELVLRFIRKRPPMFFDD